jgi:hypothetical protein
MSILQVHAPVVPPLGGFARVISFFKTFAEVFLDAQTRGRGRSQALSVHRLVRCGQAAPSTTRMSRSTLPVPSALSASL